MDQGDNDFIIVDPIERQPSYQELELSKRQPKRDRNAPRKSAPVATKPKSLESTAAVVEVEPRKATVIPETGPRPTRAGNDPRNQTKAMAADKSAPLEPAEHDSDTAEASVKLPKSNAVDEAVTEMEMHEAPSATPEAPSASTEEPSAFAEAPSASAEEPIVGSDVESETAADIQFAAERAKPERPSRASNDPREVKRREREAALRARGVTIASNANDQDTTDGSSSS